MRRIVCVLMLLVGASGCVSVPYSVKIPATLSTAKLDEPTRPEPEVEKLRMTEFDDLSGTPYQMAWIHEESRGGSFSSSSSGGAYRNIVFLDTRSLESHRLFVTNGNKIVQSTQLRRAEGEAGETTPVDPKRVEWIMLHVAVPRSTDDETRDSRERIGVSFVEASGHGHFTAIPAAERILGTTLVAADQAVVAYVADGKSLVSRIDLRAKKITATEPLAPLSGAGDE